MKLPHAVLVAIVLALAGCAGVGTPQSRSDEKAEAFDWATKNQRKLMLQGWVDIGFTPDMVYIAFGKPDVVTKTADRKNPVWVYTRVTGRARASFVGEKVTITPQFPTTADSPYMLVANDDVAARYAPPARTGLSSGLENFNPTDASTDLLIFFDRGRVDHFEMKKR